MAKSLTTKYVPNRAGVKKLGMSDVTSKAAGRAAGAVLSAARTLDPEGDYEVRGISTFAGFDNEPRNAAVIEGKMWPGASNRALLTAVETIANQLRG